MSRLKNLLSFNIPKKYQGDMLTQIKLINSYVFVGCAITFSYMIYWSVTGVWSHFFANGALFLIPLTSLVLIFFDRIKGARILMFYLFPLIAFNTCAYLYGNLGIENYVIVLLVTYIFMEDDRKKNILYSLFSIMCVFSNKYIYQHTTPISSDFEVVGEQFYNINLFMSFIAVVFYLFAFKNEIFSKNQQIDQVLSKLKVQYTEEKRQKEAILELSEELNHRVKNNLQIISSLIQLDIGKVGSTEAKASLNAVQRKILSLSILHKQLHKTNEQYLVLAQNYLDDFIEHIKKTMGTSYPVQLISEPEDLKLDSNSAPQVGVIINELLTNTVKHTSINDDISISITIKPAENEQLYLCYHDTGNGFDDIETVFSKGYGLNFIRNLCRHYGGDMTVSNKNGAMIELTLG